MNAGGYGEYGFFLGIAPGVAYALWNLSRVQRVVKEAQRIARDHGEILDIDSSPSIRFDYIFRPKHFIRPEDGVGVRLAKSRLHAASALIAFIGAILGVIAAVGIASGP